MSYGKLYECCTKGGPLFLRTHAGEADAGFGTFKLSTMPCGNPAVESDQTGRIFVLSWEDVIDMAVESGIDDAGKKALLREGAKRREAQQE